MNAISKPLMATVLFGVLTSCSDEKNPDDLRKITFGEVSGWDVDLMDYPLFQYEKRQADGLYWTKDWYEKTVNIRAIHLLGQHFLDLATQLRDREAEALIENLESLISEKDLLTFELDNARNGYAEIRKKIRLIDLKIDEQKSILESLELPIDSVTECVNPFNYIPYSIPTNDVRTFTWDGVDGSGVRMPDLKSSSFNLECYTTIWLQSWPEEILDESQTAILEKSWSPGTRNQVVQRRSWADKTKGRSTEKSPSWVNHPLIVTRDFTKEFDSFWDFYLFPIEQGRRRSGFGNLQTNRLTVFTADRSQAFAINDNNPLDNYSPSDEHFLIDVHSDFRDQSLLPPLWLVGNHTFLSGYGEPSLPFGIDSEEFESVFGKQDTFEYDSKMNPCFWEMGLQNWISFPEELTNVKLSRDEDLLQAGKRCAKYLLQSWEVSPRLKIPSYFDTIGPG